MSLRVYGAEQNPAVDHFLYRCSASSGAAAVESLRAKPIVDGDGRIALQLLPGAPSCDALDVAESIGGGLLIPFARTGNPLIAPQKLHYETPMAGDRSCLARHRHTKIHVSGRNMFSRQRWEILPGNGNIITPARPTL